MPNDVLILEALMSDRMLVKLGQAGPMSSILGKMKDYVVDHIKKDGIVNILAPATLGALGHPVLAIILTIAEEWFGLNLDKIFGEIANEVKSLISSGAKTTSSAVENMVHGVVMSNIGQQPTQQDLDKVLHKHSMTLEEAKLYNIAIIGMTSQIKKHALGGVDLLRFIGLQSTTARALSLVIGWLVKVVLWAAGFMVAGDAIHAIMGGGEKSETSTSETSEQPEDTIPTSTSTQTAFKENPNFNDIKMNMGERWIEPVPPNRIADDIVQWVKAIYPDTKDMDAEIRNTTGFQQIVKMISDYNRTNTTDITFMPKAFSSKKDVVDRFIDEVAQKAPKSSTTPIPPAQPPTKSLISDKM
jgi:hypothetical protein